jgi:hypothetical protein
MFSMPTQCWCYVIQMIVGTIPTLHFLCFLRNIAAKSIMLTFHLVHNLLDSVFLLTFGASSILLLANYACHQGFSDEVVSCLYCCHRGYRELTEKWTGATACSSLRYCCCQAHPCERWPQDKCGWVHLSEHFWSQAINTQSLMHSSFWQQKSNIYISSSRR